MQFSELGQYADLSYFSDHAVFKAEITGDTPHKVALAIKHIQVSRGDAAAHNAVSSLIDACDEAMIHGDLDSFDAVVPKSIPGIEITSSLMMRFTIFERLAIMLAMSEGMSLDDVVRLKRKDAMARKWSEPSIRFVKAAVPRLGAPWLFWRESAGIPMPLLDLPAKWHELMPMSFEVFCDDFNSYGYMAY